MSNYKLGYFIVPTDENSTGVKIKDKFGSIRYSINPQMVTVMFVKVNVINVRTKSSNNSILIDFATNSEAKLALVELRLEMDKIKNRIIKETEKVDSRSRSWYDFY
jgi:RNA recognition motif-containing protein